MSTPEPSANTTHEPTAPRQTGSGDLMQVELVQVEPVAVNSASIVAIGTAIWLVLALICTATWGIGQHGHQLWAATAFVGVGLGLCGLLLIRKHRGEGRTK